MILNWLKAFRLRTLPLAFSSVITGTVIAMDIGFFDWITFILALTTTFFLQILSNLANDYGDSEKGTDNENRIGPIRAIQSGVISKIQMKKAIIIFIFLCLLSGFSLVFYASRTVSFWYPSTFILVGLLAIISAIKYTAGKGAYGYKGMGDLFVFIFFGLVGVIGTAVLNVHDFHLTMLLPAITIGCFSASVLNLNNMRDWENDKASNKNTLVVKVGLSKAKKYHFIILIIGIVSSISYVFQKDFILLNLTFIVAFIPIVLHLKTIVNIRNNPSEFDPELKKVAIATFLFSILFLVSVVV